jgi:hypothetical protein
MIRQTVQTVKEGETFTEELYLRGQSLHAVIIEGWENIKSATVALAEERGCNLPAEVGDGSSVLYFVPPQSGFYRLTIFVRSLLHGRKTTDVSLTIKELALMPFAANDVEEMKKAG